MIGADDLAVPAAGHLESPGYYVNKQLKGHFDNGDSANDNPAFVEDDESVEEERPSIYPILDGGSRGQGVAPASSAQPHGLTNETVIKYVKADYEELPHSSARMQDEMSGYTHIDDGTVVVGAGPFYTSGGVAIPDGKQHLVSPTKGAVDGKTRRRSNPLYDFPVTRFPVSEYPRGTQGPCGSSWFCCAIHTLVFLLAAAALILAIISFVTDRKDFAELVQRYRNLESNYPGLTDLNRGNSSDFNYIVHELQKTIVDLQFKVQTLETVINWQSGFNQNLSSQVDSQTKQISRLDVEATNITNTVDLLKKDLSYQISQVPRGLVNLTSCGHNFQRAGTPVGESVTTTNPLNLNATAVLSVVCSTEGGTQALLRFDRNSPNVYSCECSGQMSSSIVSRFCYIHYWTCPILP